MKVYFKSIVLLIFVLMFSACSSHSNKVVLDVKKRNNFEEYVNKIEAKFRKCFTVKYDGGLLTGRYVVREDLQKPRHTRLYLYIYPSSDQIINVISSITIIKGENGSNRLIINDRELFLFKNVKKWYDNNMECENETDN